MLTDASGASGLFLWAGRFGVIGGLGEGWGGGNGFVGGGGGGFWVGEF